MCARVARFCQCAAWKPDPRMPMQASKLRSLSDLLSRSALSRCCARRADGSRTAASRPEFSEFVLSNFFELVGRASGRARAPDPPGRGAWGALSHLRCTLHILGITRLELLKQGASTGAFCRTPQQSHCDRFVKSGRHLDLNKKTCDNEARRPLH